MATIEEILGECSVVELRDAADGNGVSRKGAKAELVSRLASSVPLKKALECMSKDQVQEVLAKYEKSRSGNKDELVRRVVALVKPVRQKTQKQEAVRQTRQPMGKGLPVEERETAYSKGRDFEDQVAKWAKRRFRTAYAIPGHVRGGTSVRGHQVDVHVRIERKRLFGKDIDDIWIECKNMKASVKRTHIEKLVNAAQDVCRAAEKGGQDYYFNGLIVVSKSRFDIDALNYADMYGVLCVQVDAKGYAQVNKPEDWLRQPKWLKQVQYTLTLS